MSLSERLLNLVREETQLCAEHLNMPVADLLADGCWDKAHLQRRMTDLPNELKWKAVWDSVSDAGRMRRLEASGPIARAWLKVIPTDASLVLADDQVRHGLRYLLLSDFEETIAEDGKCNRCKNYSHASQELNPCHFTTCGQNQSIRTFRHNTIAKTLKDQITTSFRANVTENHVVGIVTHSDGRPEEAKSDLYFERDSEMREYDVGITALKLNQRCDWPSWDAVEAALVDDGPAPADRPVWARAFSWENHSDALTHPEARRIRKFRELAWKVGVQPSIETMERTKENWYRQAEADHVIPIIFTAGGAMSARTKDLLLQLVFFSASREDSQVEAETRARLYGRISVVLLKFSRTMAKDQSRFA